MHKKTPAINRGLNILFKSTIQASDVANQCGDKPIKPAN
jgi:hypothetical protein